MSSRALPSIFVLIFHLLFLGLASSKFLSSSSSCSAPCLLSAVVSARFRRNVNLRMLVVRYFICTLLSLQGVCKRNQCLFTYWLTYISSALLINKNSGRTSNLKTLCLNNYKCLRNSCHVYVFPSDYLFSPGIDLSPRVAHSVSVCLYNIAYPEHVVQGDFGNVSLFHFRSSRVLYLENVIPAGPFFSVS